MVFLFGSLAAKRTWEDIERDVDKWLSTVDKKIREEIEKVTQDEEKAKKNCFIGLCPNPWTPYRHSLKAEEETNAVAEILEQGTFERVSYSLAPQVGFVAAPVKGFEEFESRTLVLNGIMEALKEDGVGMGGIGKTTIVKQVARKVDELFDSVVIATVTQTLDVKDGQNQIGDLLGLKFDEQSMVGRAHRLRERLSKEDMILIVLDDISDLKSPTMEVAKKCVGLPLAIATVASALRNKCKFERENALR